MAGRDDRQGIIAAGQVADLAILDADVFTVDTADIPRVGVRYTVLGGDIVYAA